MEKTFTPTNGSTTTAPSRLILLEFNELCPGLLDRFMSAGLVPNFRKFYDSALIFTTDAMEEPEYLEPWIQWVTVHSGLSFGEHGIEHLGDGPKQPRKEIAEILSDAGVPVGVFGSMNTNYTKLRGYHIADPWSRNVNAHPGWLRPYHEFVSRQVQESSRDGAALSATDMARFGWFIARHGLKPSTGLAVVQQLREERSEPELRWRRPCLLERLQYDVSLHLNRRLGIRFATLFCNSTAHFQHYYWRNMEPEIFEEPPSTHDHTTLGEAILAGYRAMDALLGRSLRDYPDAVLVLCSALSQRPWVDTSKCTYRPRSFDQFLAFAGIPDGTATVRPVMAEQFLLEFGSREAVDVAERQLRGLHLGDDPLMLVERQGLELFVGCRINDADCVERTVANRHDGVTIRFGDLLHLVHGRRSARHHPEGILWIRTGRHAVCPAKTPLTDIAPTILAHFGVPQPPYMRGQPLPIH